MTDLVPLPETVLEWGRGNLRDLPWRRTRDPWEVLVAEVMLQQTQVQRVVDLWEAFLERFPTPAACASSPPSQVIAHWAGLGYNRRALYLHRCAVKVEEQYGGQFPHRLDDLLALPGVGPYTARAVLAFAFERDTAVVDTNVDRILARWSGQALKASEAQKLADRSVPVGEGWAWNQTLLDLGATVCRHRDPECDRCPLGAGCAWKGDGFDPARASSRARGTQSPFEGSDRQGRGRLVTALREEPVEVSSLAETMGWPGESSRAERIAGTLITDGLVERVGDSYTLRSG